MKSKKLITSLIYKMIERVGSKGLGLIISIVLARLLSPNEFGQVAILTVFINLSHVIVQSGLNTALIQRKDVTEEDYSTVFYINLVIAAVCIVILHIAAPYIGVFYNDPVIIQPLRVYSLVLIVNAFNAIQVARFQKELRFKDTMRCSLISTMLAGIIGIAMACCNFGLWSLIVYYMSSGLFSCISMMIVGKWRPILAFSVSRAKLLFQYGWKIFLSAIMCSLYADMRSMIISKRFSTADLGYYSRGQQIPQVASNALDTAIQSVMFPVLASIQDEIKKVKGLLRNSVALGTFFIVPLMLGLAATSESVVRILFGEKWLPCVEYMRWICIADASIPVLSSNLISIKAIGRSDIYVKLEGFRRIIMLAILCISLFCFDSVLAIAIGFAVSSWVDALIVIFPVQRLIGYTFGEQLKDMSKTLLASGLMLLVVQCLNRLVMPYYFLLPIQVVVGIAVYIGCALFLKNETLVLLFTKLRQHRKNTF